MSNLIAQSYELGLIHFN